jgi:glycerol-3-phosphate dehydrogenase
MPAVGDILVPIQTVAVSVTTAERDSNPDRLAFEPCEIKLMLEEGEKLFPGFKEMRMVRAWAGVRPLYQETKVTDTRDMTRAYTLLDHESRDGVAGFITITGGKWTTYRQMAQVTADRVCEKLGTEHPCRTDRELLPVLFGPGRRSPAGYHYLGARLQRTEQQGNYGALICECEMATQADVEQALNEGQAKTFDDVRRDIRLGMGPCQGGFCTFRVTGLLYARQRPPVIEANVALRDFLQERWKGIRPILWGPQLKQERLDELIYLSLLNADHLPGERASRLRSQMYEPGTVRENPDAHT